jgi:hypothetical protein
LIDKYNLLSNYAVARDQAFKKSTIISIISAFRRCGICPLDESAVPEHYFEPARNYTTKAAMPLAPHLPALLVIAPTDVTRQSSSATASRLSNSTSAPSNTASTSQSGLFQCVY